MSGRTGGVGWYVHHQGRGHLHRLEAVARHLAEPPHVLSSAPPPPGWPGGWDVLPLDVDDREPRDPTAGGTLHWAPLGVDGLLRRGAAVVRWVERTRPSLVVVDVSVEVTLLVRLLGVPVAVVAMQGDRTDRAHRHAYDAADLLLAPWPKDAPVQGFSRWKHAMVHTGALSRFDGRSRALPAGTRRDGRTVLLLWGGGGDAVPEADLRAAQDATPGWRWVVRAGGPGASDDVWPDLLAADVVVVHGGQNAVSEVAAARRPAIVVAQPRPHQEQAHRVRTLREAGLCVALDGWPQPQAWPDLLARAREVGGGGWVRWSPGDGADVAARAIEAHARGEDRR
ncbi:hypothetical protein GCM10028777_38520 [Angustibacter speluncae]